ncbi:MAG: cytidylate kinase-like family protein [Bacteroides sp.]|nr:cytidylate kinase-like family protein [Bacillota bacterium]MCM1393877.1 cytidylate kinase-like family protein [[Eubacterium] siraeum]MCM1455984.1 cytidylate kinase-like family protein [Bacteroides sp.]
MNTVITISRQYGSGGRLIGKLLAERLEIPFYDKEIILQAAEKSGLAAGFIEENEQKRKSFDLYPVANVRWGIAPNSFDSFEAKIYAAEADAIENCAKRGACVIVGRCADYVLKGKAKCLNVFIHADDDERIRRVIEEYKEAPNEKKAQKLLRDIDRNRARHYEYYTDAHWGKASEYDLCLNSSSLGVEKCIDILAATYRAYDAE